MTRTVTVALRATNDQFDGAYRRSTLGVREFDHQMQSASRSAIRMRQNIQLAGGSSLQLSSLPHALKGAAVAGVGAAVALGYAAKTALEFDKSMRNVNSISHLSEKQLGGLEDQVISLSKTLPQSATTLANGMYDIASSGFSGSDGLKVLKASAVSASAGMTDTATAAQAITAVLNAYGLSAAHAGDVSDQLFQTVNLGVTDFASLAHNVGDYIGQAKALGLSFDQTQSAIATLTLTGTNQAQAGSALGSVLTMLIRPQQGLAAAIHQTGYESGSAMVQALGLRGTLLRLSEATGGSAEGMGKLFTDSQALRSVLQLVSNGGKTWTGVAKNIEDPTRRAGAAQKALAEQAKSVSYQLGVARNKLDAAALALGQQLIPLLAQGVAGGLEFGDATAAALKPLQPLFADLGHAIEDVIHIGGDLAGELEPVAEDLAKLAALPVVALLEGLAKALEQVTGLLADHKTIVLAVAIAYGITLAGGMGRVVTAVGVQLVLALARALAGIGAMVDGAVTARAALTGMLSSGAAATVGFSAALAVGITIWSGYTRGAHEATQAVQQAKEAMARPADLSNFHKAAEAIAAARDQAAQFVQSQKDKPLWEQFLSPGDEARALGLGQHLHELQDQAHATDLAWRGFQDTVRQVLESRLSGKAADDFHNSMVLSGKAFADVTPTLQAAGVQVGDTFDQIKTKLDGYQASSSGAAGGSQKLLGALQGITTGATDTTTAVDRLKSGLDQLLGVFLSSDEASIAFEKSLDDMTATLKKNGHSLDITTEKGRANKSAIIDGVKALEAKLEAEAAAGQSAQQLAATLLAGRQALIDQAAAAGLSKTAMDKLLATYNLTPALVSTVISAVGTDTAIRQAKQVKAAVDALGDKTVTLSLVAQTVTAIRTALPFAHGHATGGLIEGPGTGTSDSIVARLSDGEFVVNAAATKKNLPLLKAINGTPGYAAGGQVRHGYASGGRVTTYSTRGGTLSHQAQVLARSGGTADDVRALMASYDDYLAKLDQVRQREQLLDDLRSARTRAAKAHGKDRVQALKDVAAAQARVNDFDRTAAIDAQRAATDKLVTSLEAQAAATTAAKQAAVDKESHRQELMDNKYSLGLVSAKNEAADLTKRMSGLEQYSNEWMRLYAQRQQVLADGRQKELDTVTVVDLATLPARAGGGPITAGTTYLTGERGPELFTANRSGWMFPNHQLSQLLPHARSGAAASHDESINIGKVVLAGGRSTARDLARELAWMRR